LCCEWGRYAHCFLVVVALIVTLFAWNSAAEAEMLQGFLIFRSSL